MNADLLHRALGLRPDEAPFAWQRRLLAELTAGRLPTALDLPTGLGKTSVMAIWLVALAAGARLPRRLVYVVDRRVVVDQATYEADRLRKIVADSPALADGLRLGDRPLPISTLRGQFIDNKEWLADPADPAIIIGTVDMIGSRLLFEGYGVSRKMRPVHAGLLGADTLVVLDESHLVPPFEKLLAAIADGQARLGPQGPPVVQPLRLLSLSATGHSNPGAPFTLREDDLTGVVAARLGAIKRLAITDLGPEDKLADKLAAAARALVARHGPCRVIVFCNRRDDAQKAAELLQKPGRGEAPLDVDLLVGARRVHERVRAAEALAQRGFLAGSRTAAPRAVAVVLVATSAGEVGIDLDADHMVCDLVAWERMVQRLGRVNRRGGGAADVEVLVAPPAPKKDPAADKIPTYRAAVARLPAADVPDRRDASPGAIHRLKRSSLADPALAKILADATTSAPLYPALARPIVDSWAMTSLDEHAGRPKVGPWLRGWVETDPQTTIIWRRFLPRRAAGQDVQPREIVEFFEAAPPHTSEQLETETFRAMQWLLARVSASGAAAADPIADDETVAFLLDPAGDLNWTLSELRELGEDKANREVVERRLAAGVLIVDARLGGLSQGLLNETESAAAPSGDDGADADFSAQVGFRVREEGPSEASGEIAAGDKGWQECYRFITQRDDDGDQRWLSVYGAQESEATPNARAISTRPQLLEEHARWAEERAQGLGRRLGLAEAHVAALALAARLHDEGKAVARWQEAFRAPRDKRPYAKTRGPIDQARLDGYRHELGSFLAAAEDPRVRALDPDLRDLVLHLIVSHHGFARPMISLRGVDALPPSRLTERAREISERFARLQERWGPWGLAWWEALLRAADQQASKDNDLGVKEVR